MIYFGLFCEDVDCQLVGVACGLGWVAKLPPPAPSFIPSKRRGGPATDLLTKKETLLNAKEINTTNTKKIIDDVLPIEVPRIFAIRIC